MVATLSARHIVTRPIGRRTNGKVERFNQRLLDERAHLRFYRSNQARPAVLPGWVVT
jgi:hypothetical protein